MPAETPQEPLSDWILEGIESHWRHDSSTVGYDLLRLCREVRRLREAEAAARAEQREADAKRLEREADKYEKNGDPGPLGYNFWGWREFAVTLRKQAAAIRGAKP